MRIVFEFRRLGETYVPIYRGETYLLNSLRLASQGERLQINIPSDDILIHIQPAFRAWKCACFWSYLVI